MNLVCQFIVSSRPSRQRSDGQCGAHGTGGQLIRGTVRGKQTADTVTGVVENCAVVRTRERLVARSAELACGVIRLFPAGGVCDVRVFGR